MAEETKAAAKAAKAPTSADIERAREFAREPFLLEGEKPKDLASGTPRRRALDAALVEIDDGREAPSIEWRRDFSLLLGLERLLSEETPHLADGAELSAHQVDALSGTLAALIADVQERINGHSWAGNGVAPAVEKIEDDASENGAGADTEDAEPDGDEDVEDVRTTGTTSTSRTRRPPRRRRPRTGTRIPTRTSSRRRRRTPAPTAASGSSTPPAPARPSPPLASSRPRGRAAS